MTDERVTRLIIAAVALILLIAVFVLAMFFRPEFARDILLVIGTLVVNLGSKKV